MGTAGTRDSLTMNPQWIMNEGHPEGTVYTKDLVKSLNLLTEDEHRADEEKIPKVRERRGR